MVKFRTFKKCVTYHSAHLDWNLAMIRWSLCILGLCSCCFVGACSSHGLFAKKITTKASYETCAAISSEDMKWVNEFNKKAVAEMTSTSGCYQKAETYLKKALSIDPNCGKAHYNLGVLYAKQNNYYLAALEFEKAQNLMNDRESKAIVELFKQYPKIIDDQNVLNGLLVSEAPQNIKNAALEEDQMLFGNFIPADNFSSQTVPVPMITSPMSATPYPAYTENYLTLPRYDNQSPQYPSQPLQSNPY